MTEITQEQIEKLAREIGQRPYRPYVVESQSFVDCNTGVSIRQELMRTAMGAILSVSDGCILSVDKKINCIDFLNVQVDAILIQMAKDELGVK